MLAPMIKYFSVLFLTLLVSSRIFSQDDANSATQNHLVKIVFVGASITHGVGVDNMKQDAYPAQLQTMLGPKYKVDNYGVSGCTMQRKGNLPYWNTREYQLALADQPALLPDKIHPNTKGATIIAKRLYEFLNAK
jgi:lysophospholipase L1-like esterase